MNALLGPAFAETAPDQWGWLTLLVVVLGEVLAVLFVFRLILIGSRPGTTMAWIVTILAAPYLGLLAYYLLGRRIHLKRLRFRQSRRSGLEASLENLGQAPASVDYADPLLRLLCNQEPDSVHEGNSMDLLGSGEEFWRRAHEIIAGATSFIHLEVYILRADNTGKQLLQLLTERARQGVEVRVLYDSVGSWALGADDLEGLHGAGGMSAAFLPLLWRRRPFTLNMRNHRKLLVVDGSTAFVGGRNVGDEYAKDRFGTEHKWLDCMVKVEGPVVGRLHRTFVQDWHTATEEVLSDEKYFPELPPAGDQVVAVVEGGPDVESNALHWMFLQMLMSAERTIRISSPYLVPNPGLLEVLLVAAARGVKVRIHTNGPAAENRLLMWAKRSFYPVMLAGGVEVTETVGDYNHSKVIIVDEQYFFVGSPNLDVRSEELNFEIGVMAADRSICRQAIELFESRIADGRRITPEMISDRWPIRFLHGVGRLVSPLL